MAPKPFSMSDVKIYLDDGTVTDLTNYQAKKGLGPDQLGIHFSLNEPVFERDTTLYSTVFWSEPLIDLLDAYRKDKGAPVVLTSVFRSKGRQQT